MTTAIRGRPPCGEADSRGAGSFSTSDPPSGQDYRKRAQEDREIQAERPVVQVGEIVAELDLRLRRVVARDLRESGHAGTDRMAQLIARHRRREARGELGPLRPRADETHVASENGTELGHL